MPDEQPQKLYEAFCRTVKLPPGARRAFLDQTYGDDPALLTEVLALLDGDEEANRSGFLDPPFPEKAEELPNFDDRFRVIRKLGEGGMGVVYLAEQRVMERLVALKVIRHDLTATPALIKRLHQEAVTAGKLTDRNIVTTYDAIELGGSHVLVMEYVEGTDLARWLKDHGPMPIPDACNAVCQAASGLQHAFDMEMVHRDVKPQNLMRTPKGLVKILDFGVARLASGVRSDATPSPLLGTANFIAPEQIKDPENADTRSDIYSLGCTLYALLSGHPPFPKGTVAEALAAQAKETPEPIGDIPASLNLILARMMAKDPTERYQTPNEVAEALAPFAVGMPRRTTVRRRWIAGVTSIIVAFGLLAAPMVAKRKMSKELPAPTNFVDFGGHFYRLTSGLLTWHEAEAEAVALGGHLIAINSQAEQIFVSRTFPGDLDLWTGLVREPSTGTFAWTSGEPLTYTNWHMNEPNNLDGVENCVYLNENTYKWNDSSELVRLLGIIEIP